MGLKKVLLFKERIRIFIQVEIQLLSSILFECKEIEFRRNGMDFTRWPLPCLQHQLHMTNRQSNNHHPGLSWNLQLRLYLRSSLSFSGNKSTPRWFSRSSITDDNKSDRLPHSLFLFDSPIRFSTHLYMYTVEIRFNDKLGSKAFLVLCRTYRQSDPIY